jgi:hypothetical protein
MPSSYNQQRKINGIFVKDTNQTADITSKAQPCRKAGLLMETRSDGRQETQHVTTLA